METAQKNTASRVVVDVVGAKRKKIELKPISIRLRTSDIVRAQQEAQRLAIPYQTILRGWIAERVAQLPQI